MSTLLQRFYLHCNYQHARKHLEGALATLASPGEPEIVRLSISIDPGSGQTTIDKTVRLLFTPAENPLEADPAWNIAWSPCERNAYPKFDGALALRADHELTWSVLELCGTFKGPVYDDVVPLDTVVQSRIVSATAREILRKLGREIESYNLRIL